MLAIALLFAPLCWLTGNDVLAYNLVVLFTFAGSVVTTYAAGASVHGADATPRCWRAWPSPSSRTASAISAT